MTRRRGDKKTARRVPASSRPRVPASVPARPVITLLTDFGTSDYFVSAMKGVILSINPTARIVDITHEIPAQDIEAAAFTCLVAHSRSHQELSPCSCRPGRRSTVEQSNEAGNLLVGGQGIFSYSMNLITLKL